MRLLALGWLRLEALCVMILFRWSMALPHCCSVPTSKHGLCSHFKNSRNVGERKHDFLFFLHIYWLKHDHWHCCESPFKAIGVKMQRKCLQHCNIQRWKNVFGHLMHFDACTVFQCTVYIFVQTVLHMQCSVHLRTLCFSKMLSQEFGFGILHFQQ